MRKPPEWLKSISEVGVQRAILRHAILKTIMTMNNKISYALLSAVGGILFSVATPASAFVVQDTGITPGETVSISVTDFYTGEALAGVNKLIVNGVARDGFCIDPFHFSVSSSPGYEYRDLALAPKAPGTMDPEKADLIRKLWSMVYSPMITAEQAAGLQIAIWEIVGGDNFSILGNDFGAAQMLKDGQDFSGRPARLIALSGPGQDYVVPPVPEGGSTLMLLVLAAVSLFGLRRFSQPQRAVVAASSSQRS